MVQHFDMFRTIPTENDVSSGCIALPHSIDMVSNNLGHGQPCCVRRRIDPTPFQSRKMLHTQNRFPTPLVPILTDLNNVSCFNSDVRQECRARVSESTWASSWTVRIVLRFRVGLTLSTGAMLCSLRRTDRVISVTIYLLL